MVENALHAVQLDVEKEWQNQRQNLFMCEFCLWVKMQENLLANERSKKGGLMNNLDQAYAG